jgi:glycosyltransferase involved in cell wall biosynthesis
MKPLSVLFINRVYPPGDGATGQLLLDLSRILVRRGHHVTIVTSQTADSPAPTEPSDGVQVERVRVLRLTRTSHWRRALSYLSVYPALLWRVLRLPRADIVVTMTDPPLLVSLGPILKWIKRCRLVHWAQDVYPEVAEELGVLPKGGGVARLCTALSTWAAHRNEKIIAVGRCMKDRLIQRGLCPEKIHVIPNWTHQAPVPGADTNLFREQHQLQNRWVVMYSGNLGLAHPFEAILDAATRLKSVQPEILFLFVGSGPRLAEVRQQVQSRSLDNVQFLPQQPAEKLGHSLGAADLHLACMHEHLCGLVVPSKVYGILGAGKPCIFLGPRDCEAARLIETAQCGTVLNSRDGKALAQTIAEWKSNGERRKDAGRRAELAAANHTPEKAAAAFHEILLQAATETGTSLELQQTASSTQT